MRTIIDHYTSITGENLIASINNSAVGNYSYAYDAGDNKTAETIIGVMSGYGFDTGTTGYDDEDRLTNWERDDSNLDQSWNLSAVGDWTSFTENTVAVSRTHNAVHELTAIATTPLTYDAKGNLTTDDASLTYAWDADNMLSSATVPTAPSRGLEGTHTYTYDALGRRTSKTVDDVQSSTTETTVFVSLTKPIPYSPHAGQVQAEYTSGTAPSSPLRKYTYGEYIDEPLTLIDRTSAGTVAAGTDEPFTYHRNQQYSITALTNSTGTPTERYHYTPYGQTTITDANVRSASNVSNSYTYTGRRLDGETGLHYFRARYVASITGLFITRDPLKHLRIVHFYSVGFALASLDPSGLQSQVGPTRPPPPPLPMPPRSPALGGGQLFTCRGKVNVWQDKSTTTTNDNCRTCTTETLTRVTATRCWNTAATNVGDDTDPADFFATLHFTQRIVTKCDDGTSSTYTTYRGCSLPHGIFIRPAIDNFGGGFEGDPSDLNAFSQSFCDGAKQLSTGHDSDT